MFLLSNIFIINPGFASLFLFFSQIRILVVRRRKISYNIIFIYMVSITAKLFLKSAQVIFLETFVISVFLDFFLSAFKAMFWFSAI